MTVVKIRNQKTQKSLKDFENYKNCLEATQLENKINYLEKNKTEIDSIKEFIKKNKLMLKIQQKV